VFSATVTDSAGDTSEWSTAAAPADIVSPFLAVGVATTFNTVRVHPSEPVDAASVQPSDFFLNMAGVDRPVTGATVAPDGSTITLSSSKPWLPGQAGFMHLTAPGAIADRAGNVSLGPVEARVGGAPGDFTPPAVRRLKLLPKNKICLVATRRCKRPGARIVFASSEDGFTWVTVFRGGKLVGTRKFLASPGDNYLRFDGKIRGRRLHPGGYKMYVGVQDTAGNLTPPAQQPSVKFKVRKS
jgi:hypothetical protein